MLIVFSFGRSPKNEPSANVVPTPWPTTGQRPIGVAFGFDVRYRFVVKLTQLGRSNLGSTGMGELVTCKTFVARARCAIGASTLALCTPNLLAAEAQLTGPTAIDSSAETSTPLAQYAEFRIRIIDSLLLNSKLTLSVRRSLEAMFNAAKTVGAIEKAQWAQFNSDNSNVIPWTAKTSARPRDVYSERILAGLDVTVSRVTDALQQAVIGNQVIPTGALNLGVLGTSKSVIPPDFRKHTKEPTRSYSLLDKARLASIDIDKMFSTTMAPVRVQALRHSPVVDPLLETRVNAVLPLTEVDFGPTPPLY